MRVVAVIGMIVMLFTACKTAENFSEEEILRSRELIESSEYDIELQFARPMPSNELNQIYSSNLLPVESRNYRISLAGSGNHIKRMGDSVSVSLSYFGTRHNSVSLSETDGGIRFKGIPKNYQLRYDEKRKRSIISFDIKNRTESHQLTVIVTPNNYVQVNMYSSHRNNISYTGHIKPSKGE